MAALQPDRSAYVNVTWPTPHDVETLYLLLRSTGVNAVAAHFYDLPKCSCANCIWLDFTLRDIPRNVPFWLDREVGLGKRKGSGDMSE
jgi:hypothetical protein